MVSYRAIALGINQYQFLQPLSYAQSDAQAIYQFFVEEAGYSPDQCLLLVDSSPSINGYSTEPTYTTIVDWLNRLAQSGEKVGSTSKSEVLWVFLSGYGLLWQGEDYLLPMDAQPQQVAETAIPIRSLFQAIQQHQGRRVVVLLDLKREQSSSLEASPLESSTDVTALGQRTIALAKEFSIPVILSCQPEEFSHEVASLGHGLFATALLEALRYYQGESLEVLEQYLQERLPQLSEHHLRPVQTPYSAIPTDALVWQLPSLLSTSPYWDETLSANGLPSWVGVGHHESVNGSSGKEGTTQILLDQGRLRPSASSSTPPTPPQTGKEGVLVQTNNSGLGSAPLWLKLLLWVGGTALILGMIAGVVIRNREAFTTAPEQGRSLPAAGGQGTPLPANNPATPLNPNSATPATQPGGQGGTNLGIAAPQTTSAQANQAILDRARTLILPNQASQFSQAIREAQKIKPGQPLYAEAQADIARWSQVILDLAEGRAKQGQFEPAIATARLVPPNNPNVYNRAQALIQKWQEQAKQQRTNQVLLKAAKGLVREGQASSYNRAINAARKIPAGQPGAAEANQLVAGWSRQIYLIAQSRAARGRYAEAIQTAALIPKDTPSYPTAQKAIAAWKTKVRAS